MPPIRDFFERFVPSRLNAVAVGLAILLSLACFAKGAVYDTLIALSMLLAIPMLLLARLAVHTTHRMLSTLGLILLGGLTTVLVLQQMLPPTGNAVQLWDQVQQLTGHDTSPRIFYDISAWIHGVVRLLFLAIVFVIALCIGTSESSTRQFLYALLVSGSVCITLTFLFATQDGVPSSTYYSFTHGFVNPNNAAAYLGIMLLVGLAQAVRFLRLPAKPLRKAFLEILDQLSVSILWKGGVFAFAILLSLAGVFMTASRGGILVTLLSAALFSFVIILKMKLHRHLRTLTLFAVPALIFMVLVWSFVNFGQTTMNKLQMQGLDANSRFDIMAAVLPMIGDHPLLGVGLGNFPSVFQQYRPENVSSDGIIDKAHNSYLEFAAEMGLPVFALLLVVLGWVGMILVNGVRGREERYVVPTLGISVWVLVALYSLIDFPLQIPAIAALVVALVTICASQTDRRFSEPASKSTSSPVRRFRIRKRRSRSMV
jgi:O-antigen ligase